MAVIPKFQPHQPGNNLAAYDLVAAQQAFARTSDEITRRPQLSAEVMQNPVGTDAAIALTAGVENLIEHGLGKTVRGWRLVDIQGPAFVWRVTSPTTNGYDSTKHLALGCSATVTVKIEVWP